VAAAADVVPRLRAVSPSTRVLLFTAFPEHSGVAPALAAGAVRLLVKDASGVALGEAIREVARTGTYRGPVRRASSSAAPDALPRGQARQLTLVPQTFVHLLPCQERQQRLVVALDPV
jgi:DNA-binding NarL/FixJ family response regulator